MSTLLVIRERPIKALTLHRVATARNHENRGVISVDEAVEKPEPERTVGGTIKWGGRGENQYGVSSKKLEIE